MAEPLTPPHSVEAEQAVLGGLLIDPPAWDQVGDMVVAEDFYRPDHRLIFTAIAELVTQSKPATWSPSRSTSSASVSWSRCRRACLPGHTRARHTHRRQRARLRADRARALAAAAADPRRERHRSSAVVSDGRSARDLVDEAEQTVFEIAEQSTGRREGAIACASCCRH